MSENEEQTPDMETLLRIAAGKESPPASKKKQVNMDAALRKAVGGQLDQPMEDALRAAIEEEEPEPEDKGPGAA